MKIEEKVQRLREERLSDQKPPVPEAYQGIRRGRVAKVMDNLGYGSKPDMIDAVFALLDDQTPSWYPNTLPGTTISHGASTAHVMSHVGVLQRGKGKLDREQRDYIFKPLEEIGAVEKITLVGGQFLPGHLVAKSANSGYRLDSTFIALLQVSDADLPAALTTWASADQNRKRREMHAVAEALARQQVGGSKHTRLIQAALSLYVPQFHAGFEVLYVDDGDGKRITPEQEALLTSAGITLELKDAMPDVLLWHPLTDELWVIEAVTSDGEVDLHKVKQLRDLAQRSGKKTIGFTTAYPDCNKAAERQGTHHNLAEDTYLWIMKDPARQLLVQGAG